MTNYTTTTNKCMFNGWKCETNIVLQPCLDGHNQPAKRILEFTTLKRHKGITTHASVHVVTDKTGDKSCIIFEDYSKQVMNFPKVRATEKNIKDCHNLAIAEFDKHLTAAKIQYKIEV